MQRGPAGFRLALSAVVVLAGAKVNTPTSSEGRPEQEQSGYTRLRSRITKAHRAQIRELYLDGLSALAVAQQLGLGKSTVLRSLRLDGVEIRPQGRRLS
jgi:hypothetical protein